MNYERECLSKQTCDITINFSKKIEKVHENCFIFFVLKPFELVYTQKWCFHF